MSNPHAIRVGFFKILSNQKIIQYNQIKKQCKKKFNTILTKIKWKIVKYANCEICVHIYVIYFYGKSNACPVS